MVVALDGVKYFLCEALVMILDGFDVAIDIRLEDEVFADPFSPAFVASAVLLVNFAFIGGGWRWDGGYR